ncbi:MAG: oxidoreductase, partial [Alphaproteobacteria bacterium]
MSFSALITRQSSDSSVSSAVETVDEAALPDGNVLVAVEWAGLNYKDALVLSGQGNLARTYPHVGGIDFAGRVVESRDARYHPGQAVVLTGWRVGETRWGGYAQRARVDADMLVPLPKRFSARTAMMLGTAGLAAMLAVNRLQAEGVKPGDGEVLVTGSGGGVGTISVMLLARLGYHVAALTGRPELGDQLTRLGATRIVTRDDMLRPTGKVLDKEAWAGCIDT